MLEINTSQEPQKNGFKKGQIDEILACFNEPGLIINGLMTVGPNTKDIEKTRESFITLRKLKNKINKQERGSEPKRVIYGDERRL